MKACRCRAYKFPHRKDGGRCTAETRGEQDEHALDFWLTMPHPRRNIDHVLDDPRRGQAKDINRSNRNG